MSLNHTVTVFGAYGHTGRFVVSELRKRGCRPILAGRDAARLRALGDVHRGCELRVAAVDDPASLDHALSGAAAVINCAGPFLDTAGPVIDAALRARIHYLDWAAEQGAVLSAYERFAKSARDTAVVVIPAMAFYGGLGDLLATAAMSSWEHADEITIAISLDSWKPTRGTRVTGQRNSSQRLFFTKNKLERADPSPPRIWDFPPRRLLPAEIGDRRDPGDILPGQLPAPECGRVHHYHATGVSVSRRVCTASRR